eukprot:CAMPEP_0202876724 /NCGR_PEP_ID=MMETSP1391-20130828/29509_1 /ASSEMBLY_ACC=CAM_ASM_000867 /TAXON_ID=1034604 /ORGANISM="Chlamydomonas leiostraca, Strain SAG 11-49" /LENGTH=58 /DNA_ID=CAMNT_0049558627 /DNA_START=28 /DNA_END=207 /DNA_ORIENTATION=+
MASILRLSAWSSMAASMELSDMQEGTTASAAPTRPGTSSLEAASRMGKMLPGLRAHSP